MNVRRVSAIAIAVGLALVGIACGNSSTSATVASSLSVSGVTPVVGTTSQFKATATMIDGSTLDVTNASTWQSSNTAVAMVSSTGVVTGVGVGAVTVNAIYQSLSASDSIVLVP